MRGSIVNSTGAPSSPSLCSANSGRYSHKLQKEGETFENLMAFSSGTSNQTSRFFFFITLRFVAV